MHRPEWAWKTCPNLSLTCLTRAKPKFLWPKPSSPPPTSNHVLLRNEIHVFLNHFYLNHPDEQQEAVGFCPQRRLLSIPASLAQPPLRDRKFPLAKRHSASF